MKRILALSLPLLVSATAFAGGFTIGDLVVVTVGNGSGLNGNATAGALYEYTAAGSLVQTINLPTAASGANYALTFSGSASSEGFLHLSTDGNYLTLAGYNCAVGTTAPQSQTPTTVPRVVGVVSVATGNINTTTALTDAYSGSNIRGAVSTDGTSLWTVGNAGSGLGSTAGNRYTTIGSSTSTQLNSTTSNNRVDNIYNGQLYTSAASGTILGVATVGTGLPTTTGQVLTLLAGMPTSGTHSSYDFWFRDANTLYVADDSAVAAGGGIQKWTFNGSTWSLQYTLLNNGTTTTGCRGLIGEVDGSGNTDLFATTSISTTANTLIEVVDTGAGATATVLATAPTGDAFRGVTLIPEPGSFALAGLGLLVLAACKRLRR
jgi:hypothetical protein